MKKIISGLAYQAANTPTQVVSNDTKTNKQVLPLRIGSSFSGCGSLDVAASNIGLSYSSEYIIEWNKYAVATYVENFPSVKKIFNDIKKVNPNEVPDVDLYVTSPPCIDFSSNGLQKGFKGTSGTLVFDALNIIKKAQVKPAYLIYENVKNLVGKKFKKSFSTILDALSELGYTNYWKVLDSKNFGVPQHRERVIIVSIRNDIDQTFEFPEGNSSSDIKSINSIMIPGEDYTKYLYHEPDIKKYITKRKSSLVKKFIIKRLKQSSDKIIYDTSGTSPTLRTSCKAHFHDSKHNLRRYLTPKEKVAIQGFSQDFKWPVSKTQQIKMLGNTVSVPVYEAILKALLPDQYFPTPTKVAKKVPASITNTSTHTYTAKKTNISKSSKPDCISLLQTIKQKEGYVSGPIITQGIKAIRKTATDRTTEIIKAHIDRPLLSKNMYINQALINYSKEKNIFNSIENMNDIELITYLKDRDLNLYNYDSFADNSNTKKFTLFPYAGGKQGVNKSKMQSLVSNAFKTKKYTRFIDSFCGGVGATYNVLPILLENNIEEIVVNDINKSIINVYRQVQRNPKKIQKQLASISLEYFKEFGKFAPETREEARALHIKLEAEFKQLELDKKMNPRRAAIFLYLIHQSTGAMTDWNIEAKISKFEKSYKIINLDLLINKVALYNKILNSTKFKLKSVKYQTLFNTYKTDTNALMLIDPPYIEYQEKIETTEGCSFTYGINFDQKELLTKVKSLKCDLIYYNNHNPLIENFAIKNGFNYSKNSRTFANNSEDRTKSVEICMTKFTPANPAISYTTANCNINTRQVA